MYIVHIMGICCIYGGESKSDANVTFWLRNSHKYTQYVTFQYFILNKKGTKFCILRDILNVIIPKNLNITLDRYIQQSSIQVEFTLSFCNASNLKIHIGTMHQLGIHDGNKHHKCDICDKSFSTIGELRASGNYQFQRSNSHLIYWQFC